MTLLYDERLQTNGMVGTGLKILHLIDSGGLYGAENVILNISIGLRKRDHHSLIGCLTYRNKVAPQIAREAERLGLEPVLFTLRNKIDLTCVREIASYCKINSVSIVHSHGYKASLICLFLKIFYKIPYVITCHLWYIRNVRMKLYTSLEKICMLSAQKVIGVSEEIVNNLQQRGVPAEKLRLIHNGVDTEVYSKIHHFDEPDFIIELGLRKDSVIIGSMGRLTEQKDYKTLVNAAAVVLKQRGDIEFIVAGEGHLRSELISQTRDLGVEDCFHFLGFRDDRIPILELMEIFVLCSLDEGIPMSMLEAMAARVPVVATKVGGIPKIIKNGENGLLIDKGNCTQLGETLLTLLSNDHERKRLRENAYATVKNEYSIDQMTSKYLDVYNNAIYR